MNISVIIPNYNGKHLLEKNLPKVFASMIDYKKGTTEVIIIDDCSTDGSVDFLKDFQTKHTEDYVQLLINETNKGFSTTVNRGVKQAHGDIVILLNTDVVPEHDFLAIVAEHFSDTKLFAVGFMDKSIEDGTVVLRGRGIGAWKRGFLIHKKGTVDKTNTLWASGGSSAFRKTIWDELGGLYEMYSPFYWEDIDLSYRALKAGYKVIFDKNIIVIHDHEKGAIRSLFSDATIKRIAFRNQFYFVWINADAITLFYHFLWLPYHLAQAVLRVDTAFLLGLLHAMIHGMNVLRYRRKNQKLFIKSDKIIQEYSS